MPLETCASNPFAVGNIEADAGSVIPPSYFYLRQAAFSSAGVGAAAFVGAFTGASGAVFTSSGAATVSWVGEGEAPPATAVLSSAGAATVSFVSPTPSPPTILTGLIGWWDASVTASLSLTGSEINSVADQSGGGNTMNWTGFAKPTYSATGFNSTKPAILLGGAHALAASSFPMGTGNTLTAWYVGTLANSSTANTDARVLDYIASGGNDYDNDGSWVAYRSGSSTQSASFLRNFTAATTAATITAYPAPHRFIYTINSSGLITIYVDGVASATATKSGNWVSGGIAQIGRHLTGSNYWSGPIAECGIATGYSDAATVALLDAYLVAKWGL